MSTTYKITGQDAIRIAERESITIHCYANPIDDGGPVTPGVARQIAKEDPSLVYIQCTPTGWRDQHGNHCGADGRDVAGYFSGSAYLGPDDDGVEPCWSEAVTYRYATDSASGEIRAATLRAAYDTLRSQITPAMVADGATLWVEADNGARITMGVDAD